MQTNKKILYPELSYKITGICFKTHKELNRFCSERQFADKFEGLLKEAGINYKRELELNTFNHDSAKGNRIDFLIENKIIIDLKTKKFITKDDYFQMQRYLKAANLELGMIINFRNTYIKPKRVLNSSHTNYKPNPNTYSDHSGNSDRPNTYSDHSDVHSGNSDRPKGFTIIEVIVGIAILSSLILGVYSMYDYALKIVKEKGLREEAISIAYKQMEYLRSIDYDALGVVGGPILCNPSPCTILAQEDITPNRATFSIYTNIKTVDDPFDGSGGADGNNATNDYKKARVKVCWTNPCDENYEELHSTFAPVGIETSCVEGTLEITVLDANASPINIPGGIQVHVQNDDTDPIYDFTDQTDSNGVVFIPCLKEETNNTYKITVNNPDEPADYDLAYSTAQTCPFGDGTPRPICPKPSPYGLVNVNDLHLNVSDGAITSKTLYVDLLSVLNVKTVAQDVPNEWSINDTGGDGNTQDMPTIGIGPDDSYYFFWRSDQGNQTRIWGQKYDSNQTALWNSGNEKEISTSNNQIFPDIVISPTNGDVYLAWNDNSNGNQDAYIKRLQSADGEDSPLLSGSKKLEVSTTNQNDDQTNPQINLEDDENFFYLTWQDDSNDTNDIYVSRFNTDHTVSDVLYCDEDNTACSPVDSVCGTGTCVKWGGETKANDDGVGNIQALPATLVEPTTDDLYVVWHDDRNTDFDIYGQKINPDGTFDATWSANIKINETSSEEQSNPAMAMSDEAGTKYLYIVWQDFRNANDYDIYLAKYDTNGARIFADIELTAKDITNANQTTPSIAINSSNEIYVAWVDERNGNQDIYLQKFDTTGTAQWTYDLLVNNDQNVNTAQNSPQLVINSSGEAVIVWQDNDSGDYDIKGATFGDTNITNEGSVPLRIYGAKTIGDDGANDIYKFDDNTFVTDSNGDLDFDDNDQDKLEWDVYTFEIAGGSYQLWQTEPPLPITVNANDTHSITIILKSTNPPEKITSLATSNSTENSIQLDWIAPATAASYDIRYSTSFITDNNWSSATRVNDEPVPPIETMTVDNLSQGTEYYFAIKSANDDGEISLLSNVVSGITTTETIPPADITPLTPSGATTSSIILTWIAPGDDGNVGKATTYDIRYSISTINNDNWDSATQVIGEDPPLTAGASEEITITGLDPATPYYFAIKTSDEVPNESGLSDVASLSTKIQVFRAIEYYIADESFTGTSYDLTLNYDLENNYFVIVQGSDGDGGSGGSASDRGPDENYIALSEDPFPTGDLIYSGSPNILTFDRDSYNTESSWVGVITVVECLANCDTDGFVLHSVENIDHGTDDSGNDTSMPTTWNDIGQTMLLGGFNGSGCITQATDTDQHKSCHVKIYPIDNQNNNEIGWERDDVDEAKIAAISNVMVVEWGTNWTVQRVNVTGDNGGDGANDTDEYETESINEVVRENTWVWGTGFTEEQGIGDAAEGTLITLGDGKNNYATETTVAVGQEYEDDRNFEVYALTHDNLAVDYRYVSDSRKNNLTHNMNFDATTDNESRMSIIYNGSNGTGNAYPRSIWSARYSTDSVVTLERRRSGQRWPAWVQGIDFSGF